MIKGINNPHSRQNRQNYSMLEHVLYVDLKRYKECCWVQIYKIEFSVCFFFKGVRTVSRGKADYRKGTIPTTPQFKR
jgi:hypothetical protein